MEITIKQIISILEEQFTILGNEEVIISKTLPIHQSEENAISWCSPAAGNKNELIVSSLASLIVCDLSVAIDDNALHNKCLLRVENPRLTYSRILQAFFTKKIQYGIHPSAVIDPEAVIANKVYIGPNTSIGKCKIGEGTIIDGNTFMYDNVHIGKNVHIEAGCVIGAEGLGFTQNNNGEWEKFPHLGGIYISDNVMIGANTSIDKSTLDDSFIGKGTKISKNVHIAHNVKIGENTIVTGGVLISGSVNVGNNVWIGPQSTILNKVNIGNDAFISINSMVGKTVPNGYKVIGTRVVSK
jgi:UDP-3-O-[3-hydroxymyristoyl] glucosamine N-acyltransferase